MRIQCEVCSATYTIDDAQLTDQPIGAQCPYCGHVKLVTRVQAAPEAAPSLPAGWDPAASDLDLPDSPSFSGFERFGGGAAGSGFEEPPPPMPDGSWEPGRHSGLELPLEDDDGYEDPSGAYGDPAGYGDHGGGFPEPGGYGAPEHGTSYADAGVSVSTAADQIGWAPEGSNTACSVCGAPLIDEFDKVIGLCELHQRERRAEASADAMSLPA